MSLRRLLRSVDGDIEADDDAVTTIPAPFAGVGMRTTIDVPGLIARELAAMQACHAELAGLDEVSRARVLRWLAEVLPCR